MFSLPDRARPFIQWCDHNILIPITFCLILGTITGRLQPAVLPQTAVISSLILLVTAAFCAQALADAETDDYDALAWVVDSGVRQPHLGGATVAIVVESLASGEVLYEHNADRPMIPASNMKVVTGAAALSVLGPDYRVETVV